MSTFSHRSSEVPKLTNLREFLEAVTEMTALTRPDAVSRVHDLLTAIVAYSEDRVRAELDAVRAERDQARARVAELERPAIEAKRNEIRESLIALAAQAEADRDFEYAFNARCRLREHEEQWKREDEAVAR